MSSFRTVTPEFSASPQLSAEDFAAAAREGFTLVINNRPDGEVPGQLSDAEAEAAARAAGVGYLHVPVAGGGFTLDHVAAMASAIGEASGPVLAYCASGTRSTVLWAMSEVKRGARSPEDALRRAAEAGYDLSGVADALDRLAG